MLQPLQITAHTLYNRPGPSPTPSIDKDYFAVVWVALAAFFYLFFLAGWPGVVAAADPCDIVLPANESEHATAASRTASSTRPSS